MSRWFPSPNYEYLVTRYRISTFDRLQDYVSERAYVAQVDLQRHPSKVLVKIEPPFPTEAWSSLGYAEISQRVLAPRHQGASIFPMISESPCHVHMCVPKPGGTWENGPYAILEWGTLSELDEEGTA
jgi:hypothetical protein